MQKEKTNAFINFLRWTQQYTKTDMVYLVQGVSWLGLAQIVASISGFIVTMILANLLAPELLGEYRFLISGFSLLCILALPGMRMALRESTPKGFKGNLVPAFKIMFKWGLLGSVVSLGAALYYFLHDNINLALGFVVIATALPLNNSATAYIEYLTAIKKLKLITIYSIFTRIILLIATVTATLLFPHYSWAILIAFLFGTIVPNLFFHFKTVRKFIKPTDTVDSGINLYATHITAMTALGLIAGQLDKIFVWKFIGAGGLAMFFIAYTIPQAITRYLMIIPTLAFAKFGEKDPKLIRRTLLPKLMKYLFVISISVGLYIVMAPYLFPLLFKQYASAIHYSQVLSLTILFSAFLPIKTYLTTTKSTKKLYTLSIIPPAMRIITAVLLIPILGVWGAICALLAEGIISTILLLFFFIRMPK